eukprot:TRINITY_DN947_c0_g2_i6.p2 TRINITY_DN947_c0_g2~~TRINITY_DN947_c0_g2_i6.p2  ORF type:complete len:154 (-),score=15.14 TRINITY_DN947_c0_g2_i6:47-508(-)
MDHDTAANDAGHAVQGQAFDLGAVASFASRIGDQIRHVAAVPLHAGMMAMRLGRRIEMPLGAARIRRTAIASLMDVEAMLARGQAADRCLDSQATSGFGKADLAGYRATRAGLQLGAGHRPGSGCGTGSQQNNGTDTQGKTGMQLHGCLLQGD